MKMLSLASMLAVLALSGCTHPGDVQTTFDRPNPERNASGDPILADYVGRIPCAVADCEMMKVELVLYQNPDSKSPTTYWLGFVGVGKGDDRTVIQGTWSLRRGAQDYPEAVVYELDSNTDPAMRYYWRVNEDIVLPLDPSMRPKSGNGAWGNMLSRDSKPYGPRTYCYDQRTRRFVASALCERNSSGRETL